MQLRSFHNDSATLSRTPHGASKRRVSSPAMRIHPSSIETREQQDSVRLLANPRAIRACTGATRSPLGGIALHEISVSRWRCSCRWRHTTHDLRSVRTMYRIISSIRRNDRPYRRARSQMALEYRRFRRFVPRARPINEAASSCRRALSN